MMATILGNVKLPFMETSSTQVLILATQILKIVEERVSMAMQIIPVMVNDIVLDLLGDWIVVY